MKQKTNYSQTTLRAAEASNPFTAVERLYELAEDRSPFVRSAIVFNTATPDDLLVRLSFDYDRHVAIKAQDRLRNPNIFESVRA